MHTQTTMLKTLSTNNKTSQYNKKQQEKAITATKTATPKTTLATHREEKRNR